jgi:AcrR family transcriptional regulator
MSQSTAERPEGHSIDRQKARRGRPRDPGLDRAILDSAYALMIETGIRSFSVREVARRSGIPKSSIYRRWPTRAELLSAVLARLGTGDSAVPDTGDLRKDLVEVVRRDINALSNGDAALPSLAFEAREDPELAPVVRKVIEDRWRVHYPILERAVARGEVRRDIDFDTALDLVLGTLWSRLIAQRPLGPSDADGIVDTALHGIAAGVPT